MNVELAFDMTVELFLNCTLMMSPITNIMPYLERNSALSKKKNVLLKNIFILNIDRKKEACFCLFHFPFYL